MHVSTEKLVGKRAQRAFRRRFLGRNLPWIFFGDARDAATPKLVIVVGEVIGEDFGSLGAQRERLPKEPT